MSIVKTYLNKMPLSVIPRSLYWDFFISSSESIKNLLKLLSELNVKFTFFILGCLVESNEDIINEIKDQGHEIASHGFLHKSYLNMNFNLAKKDFQCSISAFKEIGITINGFRPPYLDYNENILSIVKGSSIMYISSGITYASLVYKNTKKYTIGPHKLNKNLFEIPISAPDDWELIVYKGIYDSKELIEIWNKNLRNNAVFLLHPIRIGNKKFIKVLEELIKRSKYDFITLSEMVSGKGGIALTGDVSLFHKIDLLKMVNK